MAMVTVRFSPLAKMVSSNGQGSLSHVAGVTRRQRRSAAVIIQSPKRLVWMIKELTAHSIGFACRGLANFSGRTGDMSRRIAMLWLNFEATVAFKGVSLKNTVNSYIVLRA